MLKFAAKRNEHVVVSAMSRLVLIYSSSPFISLSDFSLDNSCTHRWCTIGDVLNRAFSNSLQRQGSHLQELWTDDPWQNVHSWGWHCKVEKWTMCPLSSYFCLSLYFIFLMLIWCSDAATCRYKHAMVFRDFWHSVTPLATPGLIPPGMSSPYFLVNKLSNTYSCIYTYLIKSMQAAAGLWNE